MSEEQVNEPELYFEFAVPEGSVPTFANAVTASTLGGEVIINFGFIDPITLEKEAQKPYSSESPEKIVKLSAYLVARLALNPIVANELLERLNEVLLDQREENQNA